MHTSPLSVLRHVLDETPPGSALVKGGQNGQAEPTHAAYSELRPFPRISNSRGILFRVYCTSRALHGRFLRTTHARS